MFLSNSLGVNAPGSPIERYRLSLKLDSTITDLQETHSPTKIPTDWIKGRKRFGKWMKAGKKKTDAAMQLFWAILEVIEGSIH